MKKWEYRMLYEENFQIFLQELIHWEQIEGVAVGITKQVLAEGTGSLSEKQMNVFEKHVIEANFVDQCARCACEIAWHEMASAKRNGGYCDYCEHMRNRASEQD
jgi:hypothetical protein